MQADLCLPEAPVQEPSGCPRVALDRDRRQRLITQQVPCEVCGNAVNSSSVLSSGGADPLLAQEVQQQSQRLPFLAPRLGAS